jgi:hypothetical protein
MEIDTSLGELFAAADKYDGDDSFDRFKNETFFRYDRDMRSAVLIGFDKMMQGDETLRRPNRETAMWIARKRELDDLHLLLSRAGR